MQFIQISVIMSGSDERSSPCPTRMIAHDARWPMPLNILWLKIIAIPTLHFLFFVVLPGAGMWIILQDRFGERKLPGAAQFLSAVALGILYNALQFLLVVLVYRKFPFTSRIGLSIGKYAMDVIFLLLVYRAYPQQSRDLGRRYASVCGRRADALLLLTALLLGVLAVTRFPHVHDSGQLIATNRMLQGGFDFWHAQRYALGFSALCYFPAAIFPGIPLATLASGYKLFLVLLVGLAVIYGMDRMGVAHRAAGMFLLFFILSGSFFGLYGVMELGKDSAWSVLFSVIFMFSLMNREKTVGFSASPLFLLAAIALGMIAIPYLCLFCLVFAVLRLLPERPSAQRLLLPAAVILFVAGGTMMMPVKMAVRAPPHTRPQVGNFVSWYPSDGKTSFSQYYFHYERHGYRNSALLAMAGLLGIFLLPWAGARYRDAAVRSTALFLPVATLSCLCLSFLARGQLPASRAQKIFLTPFSTRQAWDLIKDIPQWYVQLISGMIIVIVLDAWISKLPFSRKARQAFFTGIALLAAGAALSANLPRLAALKVPAHFYRYGGHQDDRFARTLESIYRHPEVKHIFLPRDLSSLHANHFHFDLQGYFPKKKLHILPPARGRSLEFHPPPGSSILIAAHGGFAEFQAARRQRSRMSARRLVHFPGTDEGIYLIEKEMRQPRGSAGSPGLSSVPRPAEQKEQDGAGQCRQRRIQEKQHQCG